MNRTYNFTWDYYTPGVALALSYPYYQHLGIGEEYKLNGNVYLLDVFGNTIRRLNNNEYTASCPTYNSAGGEYPATVTYVTPENKVLTVTYTVCVVNLEIDENAGTYWPLTGAATADGNVYINLDFANNTIKSRLNLTYNYNNLDLSNTLYSTGPTASSGYCIRNNNRYTPYVSNDPDEWDNNHIFEHAIGYDTQRWFHSFIWFKWLGGGGWTNISVAGGTELTSLNPVGAGNDSSSVELDYYYRYLNENNLSTPIFRVTADTADGNGHIAIKIYAWPRTRTISANVTATYFYIATYETSGTFTNEQLQIGISSSVVY